MPLFRYNNNRRIVFKMFKKLLDNAEPGSYANKFRRKRFRLFRKLLVGIPEPAKIIDLGGTVNYWKQMGLVNPEDALITILNIESDEENLPNTKFIQDDACNTELDLSDFDIIFSNSLIEHVGSEEKRKKMARLVISSGKPYYIQTPNYWFPFEPHFLFPIFQFLPRFFRIFLVKNFNMGWFKKCSDTAKAAGLVDSIHLLRVKELRELFPEAVIKKEKFLFITKSLIAIAGNIK
jgi:hypothetical protein